MFFEINSYFLITRKFEHVECPTGSIRQRSAMLFIIILGEGRLTSVHK
jgi:hypothetical protein